MTTDAPPDIRAAFMAQSRATRKLGSPFMSRLMALCADRLTPGTAVADRLFAWPGNPNPEADNAPLRLAGGLYSLVLTGAEVDLAAVYPPHDPSDDALWQAVEGALTRHEAHLLDWLDRTPQTNEVRRSAALVPALHLVAAATGLPLALWEIGCSAGLNLRADRFRVAGGGTVYGPEDSPLRHAPDWDGPAPPRAALAVAERRGVDLAPLDPASAEDRLRLRTYLWPDQPHRRALTDAALEIAAGVPVAVERADALDWLARRLPARPEGAVTVLFHTVAWQYLPPDARARGEALIAAAGDAATADRPLARIGMEADGGPMAGLTLTLWPGGETLALARADFHGRAIRWTGPTTL